MEYPEAKPDLKELAAALEDARAGSPEFDRSIQAALSPYRPSPSDVPNSTRVFEDARRLMPANSRLELSNFNVRDRWHASVYVRFGDRPRWVSQDAYGETPALAVAAAGLRLQAWLHRAHAAK
ncbi:MAG: hypothetical protein U5L06_13135 [Rhodovibrio sp.]|nr:hypothetical protein [Rhodovibrio sp.]